MELYFTGYNGELPVALFDLDETLGSILPQLISVVNEKYNACLVYEDITDLICFEEILNIPRPIILAEFNRVGLLRMFNWYEEAREFVLRVRNGYVFDERCHIAIVTSRGNYWENSVYHTIKQIERNLIPNDSIAILDFHMDKIDWAKATFGSNLKYVFEDSPKALTDSFNSDILTFKSVTPYNRHIRTHGEFCASKNTFTLY